MRKLLRDGASDPFGEAVELAESAAERFGALLALWASAAWSPPQLHRAVECARDAGPRPTKTPTVPVIRVTGRLRARCSAEDAAMGRKRAAMCLGHKQNEITLL